jgi:tetratricopeptide (TPR) repeat protein
MKNMHDAITDPSHRPSTAFVSALAGLCLLIGGCSHEAREARYLASGKKMMEKNDYPRAVIQFKNATNMMPQDPEAHYQLALAYYAGHNYRAGNVELAKAVKLNPKHAAAQLKLAEVKAAAPADKPQYKPLLQESQKAVQDLLKSGESSAEILGTLAETEYKLGDKEAAEKTLEQAVAKFPKDLASAVTLASVKRTHNDFAGAEAVLKKAVAEQPKSSNAALALGQFYLITNRPADAESQFQRAVDLDPKSAAALFSLAVLQTRTNKLDQAEQTYGRLAALPNPQFHSYHAAFLAARGKQDQATAEFEKLYRQFPDDRNIRTGLSRQYLRAGKSGDVEKLLTASLGKNSKDMDALLQRAAVYLMSGRPDAARDDLEKALRLRSDSPQAHYLMAQVHAARGDVPNQRQELGQALRLQPALWPARVQLAQLLLASGSAQPALELLDEVDRSEDPKIKAQKNIPAVIVQRTWALLALKQNVEARKEVDRGLVIGRTPDLLLQDAYLKRDQKDFASARAALLDGLNRSPEDVRLLRLMVITYFDQKQPAAGVSMAQQYAAQHPKSAPVQYYVGGLLIANGQRAEGRIAMQAAKSANPKFTPADVTLAQLDASEGHVDEAAKTLSQVLAQNPQNVAGRLLLASIEDARGNHAAAIDGYKKILETQPANVLALNNLAYDLSKSNDQLDEALKYAQKGVELAPDAASVENTLGWILYRKGLYNMALPHLEKAATKEPSALRVCHLAMVYLEMGDQERGQQSLLAAMKLNPNLPELKDAQRLLDKKQAQRR